MDRGSWCALHCTAPRGGQWTKRTNRAHRGRPLCGSEAHRSLATLATAALYRIASASFVLFTAVPLAALLARAARWNMLATFGLGVACAPV